MSYLEAAMKVLDKDKPHAGGAETPHSRSFESAAKQGQNSSEVDSAHSAHAHSEACPPLPTGVRLVRYRPTRSPVAVESFSVVFDVKKFVDAELRELDARLHAPVQIRGGWGVFTILDRLAQCGLQLEISRPMELRRSPAESAEREG